MKTDTIAAIATAMSNSGIGIVRISGDEALEIADRIFRPKKGSRKVSDMETHTIHYGYVTDGEEVVDEVMLLIMKAPRSYTCEDTIEIDCHGGVLVMKKILETVLKYGARPAEPGEFTKRAFLNGRIDLSQAESVIDVINAQNDLALKSSVSQLQGAVLEKIKDIRAVVLHEIAFIESALDDPEHVSLDGYPEQLHEIMSDAHKKVKKLLDSSDNGKMLKEGINTAIVGKPNAGKSSLLNILVGEERAIVTEIAGTTRDILQEQIQIGGIGLNVIDTAGIRDTEDIVEKIGVNKSREYIEKADLIIYVVDSSTELDENDHEIIEAIQDKKAIVLLNKSDLDTKTNADVLKKYLDKPILSISAKNNTGIHTLENLIEEMFFSGKLSFNDEVYITNIRQKNALAEAKSSLQMVLQSIDDGMPEDFFTIDMMNAYETLGTIIGESVGEDLVNEIFSKFCMGK
ncbi:tRNA uridine-5-carboxymethylaminomethyl(34) synthesis GTPase MnmE [uncultured Eubacterium sp.]|uniref:tRNA uridine-5-carboxymethylaminomethyl(34) synthesis GTPase MnmE n=1 Tax=uncultured Eubacterium sp. TaxID=165185 RepID=UPI0025DCC0A4|nr:tRNA uridine-5-carboxymethylaminomethyl(34) synthesis GTPase MnmE [uncultured Eubacterium sp.]